LVNYNKCKICNSDVKKIFTSSVLKKFKAEFFRCNKCEYLFINKPFWLDEAYKTPIANADIGILMRNFSLSSQLTMILFLIRKLNYRFLDVGGGYGILTRMMRDNGYNFYWQDEYCTNIFAKGFEYSVVEQKSIMGITLFEVLEHLEWPLEFLLEKIKTYNPKYIFCSTELYDGKNIPSINWDYYALEEGQHISFYSKKTIQEICSRINYNHVYFFNDIIIITKYKINFSYIVSFFSGNFSKLLFLFIRKLNGSKLISDYRNVKNKNNL
jgi:hypothetical protein